MDNYPSAKYQFSTIPTGAWYPFAGSKNALPAGHLLANGAAVLRATYLALFNVIVPNRGTVTITLASPGVVTLNSHGLETGDQIYLATTGALPTGLTANTLYYVIKVNANTFRLATSRANAIAGTAINTSVSQSGVHTLFECPWGLGDGSTTFNLPNPSGRAIVGVDSTQNEFIAAGYAVGAKTHTLTQAELPAANLTVWNGSTGLTFGAGGDATKRQLSLPGNGDTNVVFAALGGSGAGHNNIQPSLNTIFIIKT